MGGRCWLWNSQIAPMRAWLCICHALLTLGETDEGEGGSLQLSKNSLAWCVLGAERWKPLPAALCCHSTPCSVSVLLVKSQSHTAAPKSSCRMGSGPAHTAPQKPQWGMHCITRNAWLPKDNLEHSPCINHMCPTAVEGSWQGLQDSCLLASCHGLCQAGAGNGFAMPCSRAVCPFSCRVTDISSISHRKVCIPPPKELPLSSASKWLGIRWPCLTSSSILSSAESPQGMTDRFCFFNVFCILFNIQLSGRGICLPQQCCIWERCWLLLHKLFRVFLQSA